jgi:hypothetical protein
MYRRHPRSDAFLARHGNKLAIGFVVLLLALFVLVLKMPGRPVSPWGPGWDCLQTNTPGAPGGDICVKKSPSNAN